MHDRPAENPAIPESGQRGFALVAVIWGLGLIVLLGTAIIVGARYRGQIASAGGSAAQAAAAADSAVNLALAAILTQRPDVRFPLRCSLPGGEQTVISVEEEIGKVDLNAASPALLERLFVGLTHDKALGSRIAAGIAAIRVTRRKESAGVADAFADRGGGPATSTSSAFASVTELDRVDGIAPELFRSALPFVTVRSGRAEPDREAASPPLARLLGFERPTGAQRRPVVPGYLTVRADVVSPERSRYVREALISVGNERSLPFVIREWRRGNVDPDDPSPALPGNRVRPCLTVGKAPS